MATNLYKNHAFQNLQESWPANVNITALQSLCQPGSKEKEPFRWKCSHERFHKGLDTHHALSNVPTLTV